VEPQSLRTCGSFNDGDSDDSRHVSPAIGVKSHRQVQGFGLRFAAPVDMKVRTTAFERVAFTDLEKLGCNGHHTRFTTAVKHKSYVSDRPA
jgi:hypothetical protein